MDTLDALRVRPETDVSSGPLPKPDPVDTAVVDTAAVVVHGLTKRYRGRTAVNDLSFSVPTGAVAGLIGPNGAGKTTLMAMLLGLVGPSGGTATVLGHSISRPTAYLGHVGASIETPAFHSAVSGIDNLRALAVLGGHDPAQIPDLIDRVGLGGRGAERYASYSMGMKQRLAIAASLLGDPRLVILDEPTNGLDPLGMQDIRRLINRIAAEGRTILVSSHLLSELEQVCDWLIVIDHGGLVYAGRPDDLTANEWVVVRPAEACRLTALRAMADSAGYLVRTTDTGIEVMLDGATAADDVAGHLNRLANETGINLSELRHHRDDLETRYLDLLERHNDRPNVPGPGSRTINSTNHATEGKTS